MAFARGLIEIDKAVEASSSGFGPRLSPLFWKNDGEKYILRFLTDDVIVGQFAEYIETIRDKKDGNGNVIGKQTADFLIDPDGTNWCEHFGGRQREWGTGNLIEPKKVTKGIGVAVLRKEQATEGGRVKIVDDRQTIDVDGKKFTARRFVVVKMSIGNFWDPMRGIGRRNNTIIDRDFEITRRGKDKNTKYDISPIGPEESETDLRDPAVLHEWYGYGQKWDESNPDRFLFCPQTLDEWAENYSGKERAEYFLKGIASSNGSNENAVRPVVIDHEGNTLVASSAAPARPQVGGVTGDEDETQAVSSPSSRFSSVREQLQATFANQS
jgi:hypothetical protein